MKILSAIVLSSATLALVGCGNQGGSSDPYNTESGTASNTNYDRYGITNNYQGRALSPGRIKTGADYSTNYPALGTNHQGDAANSQPIDPERTNNVPEN